MDLIELGYNNKFEQFRLDNHLENFETGRIVEEQKERYKVRTSQGVLDAEILGNLRFTAKSREDFPVVGDWVAMMVYDELAIIHKIFPRFSLIKRQSVHIAGDVQLIAANIDFAFIVQAVDRDFNLNRLERYLTVCNSSRVSPVILLTKTDLISELQLTEIIEKIKSRIFNCPVMAVSNLNRSGYDALNKLIVKGKTYCVLGSSGVGKSTLINNLSGEIIMKTDRISYSTNKGRHITSYRELILLPDGAILIDNPGMREIGIADLSGGLEITFGKIAELSHFCKFKNCSHTNEIGCRVIQAVENGEIDLAVYKNYLKLEREKEHFESTVEERKNKDREFGKFLKNYKKQMKRNSD